MKTATLLQKGKIIYKTKTNLSVVKMQSQALKDWSKKSMAVKLPIRYLINLQKMNLPKMAMVLTCQD